MKKILIVFVLLIGLLGAYFFFTQSKESKPALEVEQKQEEIQVTRKNIKEETETHVVDVVYPQFGIAAIDTHIDQLVKSSVGEFKMLPPNPPESAVPKHSFDGLYDSVYIGPDVVSFRLVLSQYTGGAHPLTSISGLNYDRATGKQLLQQDAFAMIGKTVEEVSAAATKELKSKLGDAMFEEGANSNPENFSSFVISEDKITFIFQQYQVAAYAAGVQEVSFSRK
ncbi:DUF3298 domain-containing protein [Candidatus Parcubacteria bacterium]|nr:MAG: DUF3298 domain-containing protein [Candidatus Parcubacteria bacterium]